MTPLVTDELWNTLVPLLPVHPPSPKGGRPRVADRLRLNGILFVLRESLRRQSLPLELGWGSGSTCWRRFAEWTATGVWERMHCLLVGALQERDHDITAKQSGAASNPSRGDPGAGIPKMPPPAYCWPLYVVKGTPGACSLTPVSSNCSGRTIFSPPSRRLAHTLQLQLHTITQGQNESTH
jgi:transposase